MASVVEEELRQAGRLGPDDALKRQGESRSLGRMSNQRLQQMHQGIPVFAAEVVATTSGTRVISIQGHTASNIDIDTNPANNYAETVALAGESVQDKLEPDGDGSLVILASGNDHHLCWLGVVAVNGVQQRLILDAKSGRILLRLPVSLD